MSTDELIWNVHVVHQLVNPSSIAGLLKMCPLREPDIFGLDIDSIDCYIAKKILELGFRSKIWVVEYNSAFGTERSITVPCLPNFNRWSAHPSGLY